MERPTKGTKRKNAGSSDGSASKRIAATNSEIVRKSRKSQRNEIIINLVDSNDEVPSFFKDNTRNINKGKRKRRRMRRRRRRRMRIRRRNKHLDMTQRRFNKKEEICCFSCCFCIKKFKTISLMRKHIRYERKNMSVCIVCGVRSHDIPFLRKHAIEVHRSARHIKFEKQSSEFDALVDGWMKLQEEIYKHRKANEDVINLDEDKIINLDEDDVINSDEDDVIDMDEDVVILERDDIININLVEDDDGDSVVEITFDEENREDEIIDLEDCQPSSSKRVKREPTENYTGVKVEREVPRNAANVDEVISIKVEDSDDEW